MTDRQNPCARVIHEKHGLRTLSVLKHHTDITTRSSLMKLAHIALAAAAMTLSACATAPIAGLEAGKFVRYDCTGSDFSARMSDDGKTLRLRTKEGSMDLDAAGDGTYKGDGFTFYGSGDRGIALQHKDKWVGERCKKEV